MSDVKTVVNRNAASPNGQGRTEIVFTDSWGDELKVAFNPLLQKVYFNSNVESVALNEDQVQTLMIEAAKFYREAQRND